MNTHNILKQYALLILEIKEQNILANKKIKIAEDDSEDDGTKEEEVVYGGEVEEKEDEEHEHDEYEAHKPARVYDEPLKNRQRVANRDSLVFLRVYTKIPMQSVLMSQRK